VDVVWVDCVLVESDLVLDVVEAFLFDRTQAGRIEPEDTG
jgi:hypothetical protein